MFVGFGCEEECIGGKSVPEFMEKPSYVYGVLFLSDGKNTYLSTNI